MRFKFRKRTAVLTAAAVTVLGVSAAIPADAGITAWDHGFV